MSDATSTQEQGTSPSDIREFRLSLGEVDARQKGRVTQLFHPQFGTTFLIDVNDRDDPTRRKEGDPPREEDVIKNFVDLNGEKLRDRWAINNGVVALVTDQLNPNEETRVYIGLTMSDPNDRAGKEITSHILHAAGFQSGDFYVPFSFRSGLVRKYMAKEIQDAVKESGNPRLFAGFQNLLKRTSS